MKITESDLDRVFNKKSGGGKIKITDDDLDRVFGQNERRQENAALPVSAPKTEIKTDYSHPQSNYDRDQQVASKLPAAQAQLQNMSRNKRYIINPVNQTATAVNKEQTIFGGLPGAFVESTLQGVGNAFSNMVNTHDTVKGYTAMPGKVHSDLQNVMYEPFKAENQGRVKEIVERNQQQYGLDSEYVAQIQEDIRQRNIKQTEKLEKIREKYKDVKGADLAITAGTGIGNMVPSMVVGAATGAPVIGTSVFTTNVFGGAMGEALNNGATIEQAAGYATADAALETDLEVLFGGIPALGKGILGKSIKETTDEVVSRYIKTAAGRMLVNRLIDITGEGVEEVASEILEPFIRRAFYDKDAENATLKDCVDAFGGGALVAGILGVANFKGNIREYQDIKAKIKANKALTTENAGNAAKIQQTEENTAIQPVDENSRIDIEEPATVSSEEEQRVRRAAQNIPTVQQLAENGIAPQSDVDALTDTIVGENGESRRQVAQVAAAENRKVDIMRRLAESGIADRQDLAKVQQAARENVRKAISEDITYTTEKEKGYGTLQTDQRTGGRENKQQPGGIESGSERNAEIGGAADSQRYAERKGGALSFQNRENRGLTAKQRQELDKTAVRDRSGRPKRVYHYTANTEFTQFGESRDVGFHFGNLRQASGRRADLKQSGGRIIRGYLNIKNPVNIGNDMMGYKPGVLAMKLNALGILNESEKSTIFDMALKDDGSYNSRSARALRALLEKKGYDGIVYNNLYEGEGRSYIAFYPQQVIWADENYNNIARTMQAVEEFAAGKGLKVEYFSDGDRRAPEGYINGDTVYINMASDAPIVGVAVHEVGHRLKDSNTKRWNRYARSVSRLMSTNRELAEFAEQVRDSYTDPDSVRYSSVLDENGNIDRAKVDEEVILKVTQEILKRTADGDTDFLRQIAADRSLIDRLLDFIRGIKNSITIKLTGSEMAMLDEAERNLVNLMRGESQEQTLDKYSLMGRDSRGRSIYKSDFPASTNNKTKIQALEQVLQDTQNYPLIFRINGRKVEAYFDRIGVRKTVRGTQTDERPESRRGYDYKIDLANDLRSIIQSSKFVGSNQDKSVAYGTKEKNAAHKDVLQWYTFENEIIYENTPIRVETTLREKSNGTFGYSVKFFEKREGTFSRHTDNKSSDLKILKVPSENIISQTGANNNGKKSAISGTVNQSTQTRQKNTTKGNKKNTRYSLKIDSDGRNLTDEQAAYFADSQVRDDNGALMKVYHQTGADFTRFDTGKAGAGQYDAEMPTGIFTKPTADDIGLGGQKQMELYANITNPLRFNNRAEAVRYWERNIDGYRQARRQIGNLDNEYQEKYDAADLLEDEEYKSIRQRLINKEITREEFRARLENTETKRILNEWTQKSNEVRRQAKALIDEYISKSGYDGVIVENDTGSFGRRVKSIIALNSNQLKNTDNLTPTDDDDIRYSLSVQDDIRKQVWQQTAKADNIKNRAVSDFTRQVRDIFGIDSSVSADIKTAVQDMATEVLDNGYVSPAAANRLFDKAVQLGSEIDENYRRYDELRKRINRTGIEPVGGAEYRDFLAKYRGKVKFKRGGIPLDTFYRELQEMYPEYFPDINNIYDQMEQIGRVYDDISNKSVSLEDYYGEAFRDFKEMSRTEFMERLDRFTARVNSAYRYNEALGRRQRRRQFANKAAAAGIDYDKAMQSFESVTELDNQIGRLKKQYAFTPGEIKLVEYMVGRQGQALQSRKDMVRTFPYNGEHILKLYELSKAKREIMRPLNYTYSRQKDDARAKTIKFMRSMRLAKEKQSFRGLRYTTRNFERTADRLIKDRKQNEAFKNEYVRPVHKAVTAAQRMKNEYRDKVRRLNLDQRKKYDVKFENRQGKLVQGKLSESGLVQAYGEGLINDSYLEQLGADSAKIKAAAGELKKIYRDLYRQINETYIRNGYRPMEHRRDYFPHFQEEDGFIDKIRAKLGMGAQEELPIDIAGLTSQFTPGRKWNRFALQRTTDTTAYDALKGFDMYIETAADVIHTTDIIQKLRMLESSIRYMYSDQGVKDRLDEIDNNTSLSPNEKLELKNKVYADLDKNNSGRGLTGFVQWLHGYTNGLAGKKSDADRNMEFELGRGIYTFSKNFESRVAANMIGGNISSALTNFIPITQMTAEVKGKYILAAMYDTMKNLHTNDGFDRQSDFLVRRFGSERLYETFWDKMINAPVIGQVYNLMELVDEFTSNVVTRGMYIQKINEGMESRSALQYADEFAARLMADRSKGALPTVYNEQNPVKKLFTMFQVEQANQFQYLFGDLPRIAGASGKPLRYLLFMLFKVSLWAYLFNRVYEKIAGRKPAFSPLDITFDAVGRFTGKTVNNPVDIIMGEGLIEERPKMKQSAAIIETAKDVVEQVPFIGGFLGGGRVPVSSAGVDLSNLAKLMDEDVAPEKKRQILFEELSNPLSYLVSPGGGGQIRKIWQGAQLIADDGVMYATDKYGNKTVKFAVDINPLTRAQALVFGQWASEPAQEYINSFKGLTKAQTGVFEQMKKEGRSNSQAFDFAQTINKSEEEGGADADGNGKLKSDEVKKYLDKQTNLSQSAKANIFRLLMPDVKYNPYE